MIESERVAVSIANDRAPDEERVGKGSQIPDEGTAYFDREGLELTIDLVLNADEHAPYFLGQLFVSIRQAIDSGFHGINQTRGPCQGDRPDLPAFTRTRRDHSLP